MDANTLIQLAAKAVEVLGIMEENRERTRLGYSRAYDETAFCKVADEIRKIAKTEIDEQFTGEGGRKTIIWEAIDTESGVQYYSKCEGHDSFVYIVRPPTFHTWTWNATFDFPLGATQITRGRYASAREAEDGFCAFLDAMSSIAKCWYK